MKQYAITHISDATYEIESSQGYSKEQILTKKTYQKKEKRKRKKKKQQQTATASHR